MTFSEMKQELSELIAESGTRTFTATARARWLNRGVIEVCRLTNCLTKKVTKNVTAATRSYDLVSDWSLTDFLDFADAGITHYNGDATNPVWTPLDRKTTEWLDENVSGWRSTASGNQSDTLQYYARETRTAVVFQPVPKTSVTNGWILEYSYYPIQGSTKGGLVGDNDVPFDSVPDLEPYHMLPVLYAGYRALLKAGVPKARDVLGEFNTGVVLMQRELRHKPDYEPRMRLFNYRAR